MNIKLTFVMGESAARRLAVHSEPFPLSIYAVSLNAVRVDYTSRAQFEMLTWTSPLNRKRRQPVRAPVELDLFRIG